MAINRGVKVDIDRINTKWQDEVFKALPPTIVPHPVFDDPGPCELAWDQLTASLVKSGRIKMNRPIEHHLAEIEKQVASNPTLTSAFVQLRTALGLSSP